jgi:hypothetical protein
MININQVKTALSLYIENEIANKASGLTKFLTYFVLGSMQSKFDDYIKTITENPLFALSDIYNKQTNEIDIEKLYTYAKNAMQKTGSLTMYGIIFKPEDIDILFDYMRRV